MKSLASLFYRHSRAFCIATNIKLPIGQILIVIELVSRLGTTVFVNLIKVESVSFIFSDQSTCHVGKRYHKINSLARKTGVPTLRPEKKPAIDDSSQSAASQRYASNVRLKTRQQTFLEILLSAAELYYSSCDQEGVQEHEVKPGKAQWASNDTITAGLQRRSPMKSSTKMNSPWGQHLILLKSPLTSFFLPQPYMRKERRVRCCTCGETPHSRSYPNALTRRESKKYEELYLEDGEAPKDFESRTCCKMDFFITIASFMQSKTKGSIADQCIVRRHGTIYMDSWANRDALVATESSPVQEERAQTR